MKATSLLICLALLTLTKAEITVRRDFDDIYIQKGEDVLVSLQDGFVFSGAQYPATITPTLGKAYTHLDHIYKKDLFFFGDVKFSKVFDNNKIAVFYKKNPKVTVVEFGGTSRFDKDSFTFEPDAGAIKGYSCEDLVYDSHLSIIAIACRAPAPEGDKFQKVGIFTFNADNGESKGSWQGSEDETFQIKNRIKLHIYKDEEQKEKKDTFNIIFSDSKTNNGKDEDIDSQVRIFHVKDNIILPNGVVAIPNPQTELYDLRGIHKFRNQILLASRRKDTEKKLCFTLLKLTHQDYSDFSVKVTGDKQCIDVDNGDIISGFGDQIVSYDADQNGLLVYSPSNDFSDNKWIQGIAATRADFSKLKPKGGLRNVHVSAVGILANFAQDKGVNDVGGNTLITIKFSGVSFAIEGEETAILINNNYMRISSTQLRVYLIAEPNLRIPKELLEAGKNEITIKAKDDDASAAEVTNKINVYVVNDLFDKIEFKDTGVNNRQLLEIAPGGVYKHIFKYNQIKYGNDLTFEIEYDDAAKEKLVASTRTSISHNINWHPSIDTIEDIQKIHIVTGAAMIVDKKNVHWYQCLAENEFETTCKKEGISSHYGKQISDKLGAILEIIYTTEFDEKSGFSYFAWYEIGEGWEYEHFKGRIKDVQLVQSESGKVYCILAFSDRIVVSVFYDNWYYGNRNSVVYYDVDVNDYDFCPSELHELVETDGKSNKFAVVSNCNKDHEILSFLIDDNKEYVPAGKFKLVPLGNTFIGNDIEVPEFCYLNEEVIIYDPTKKEVYSLNLQYEQLTKVPLDLLQAEAQEFRCYSNTNEFTVLTTKRGAPQSGESQQPVKQTKELVVLRGGKKHDVYNRLKTRITGLKMETERVEIISQDGDTIFVIFDSDNKMTYSRLYEKGPELVTTVLSDFVYKNAFNYKIKVKNQKTMIEQTHSIKLVDKFPDLKVTVSKKKQISKATHDLTNILSFEGAYKSVKMTPEKKDSQQLQQLPDPKARVFSTFMDDTHLEMGLDQVGRYGSFDQYDIVATYSLSTRLHYGQLKLFKNRVLLDTFYSAITYNSANFVKADNGDLLTIYAPNFSFQPFNLVVAKNDKFSTKKFNMDIGYNGRDIQIFKIPGKENEFLVMFTSNGEIRMNKFTYIPGDEDTWKVNVDYNRITMNTFKPSGRWDVTQNDKTINVYAYKRGKDQKAAHRIEYSFETNVFSKPFPLDLEDGDNFSEVVRICCSNEDGRDKCAFATAGSVLYYAEFRDNYQLTNSLGQVPDVPRKPTFTARLRKKDNFYGEKVRVAGSFVVLESKRIHKGDARYVSVWDLNMIKRDQLRQVPTKTSKDAYVSYVTSLTKKDANFHEGIDCKLLEVRPSTHNGVRAAEMVIQAEVSESTEDEKVRVTYKKLLPWSVEVTGDLTDADMNSYKVTFTGLTDGQTADVTFAQMFDKAQEVENNDYVLVL